MVDNEPNELVQIPGEAKGEESLEGEDNAKMPDEDPQNFLGSKSCAHTAATPSSQLNV